MVNDRQKLGQINVLSAGDSWAWPLALERIFKPRGVNLLLAKNSNDLVNILEQMRIHATIVDLDDQPNGLAAIKIVRMAFPMLPCLVLSRTASQSILDRALQLDVFSVIDRPDDLEILLEQLDRMFMKKYKMDIFSN
jgi:DNA-binding NtrC family response regulator